MVEKAALSSTDRERMMALLALENPMDFMSSEESEEGEGEQTTGPPKQFLMPHTRPHDQSQKRTAAKVSRAEGQCVK